MSWVTIAESDLLTRISGPELDAYRAAAIASGQDDPVAEILSGVIAEVRGRVAACARNALGDGETIPSELLHHALALAVYRLITRLPGRGSSAALESRKSAYDDAQKVLADVAACRFAIVAPTTESADQAGAGGIEIASSRTRVATRDLLDGL